ncbi:hypothetical protein VTK73DRAFT_9490 [Phialemonium thermophilum]|uniref:protein-histidine N-methyltransferase n=1 Tax=Phialemonium thermophilum TaxID=223376 RepID=A0ABR3Y5N5_9PEZI
MQSSFSFSFSGDDIDEDLQAATKSENSHAVLPLGMSPGTSGPGAVTSAFPVTGQPLLPATVHDLDEMLSRLPSKIAYSTLTVDLGDGSASFQLPRRELWDVRVQLMAEEDTEGDGQGDHEACLGDRDVKTGIYEGGFKSWESSVDLVKVLDSEGFSQTVGQGPWRVIELGCGTALPSLAVFQWACASRASGTNPAPLALVLADYNPSVLYLVTLPNFILAWALQMCQGNPVLEAALSSDGELELGPEVLEAFRAFLRASGVAFTFISGAWSSTFVDLLYNPELAPSSQPDEKTIVMGAETIYSPFALASFSETLLSILRRELAETSHPQVAALVAAKRLYFGVGGSLDDFIDRMRGFGVVVDMLREETDGVRRGVVLCRLPPPATNCHSIA